MVDAARQRVIRLGLLGQVRVGDVAGRTRRRAGAGVLGQAVVTEDLLGDRVDPVRRNDVAGERLPRERRGARAGERVVDRDERRVGREVAVAQRLGRHPRRARDVEAGTLVGDALVAEHEPRLVLPAGKAGNAERSADREAGPVRIAVDLALAPRLPEEVVRAHARRLGEVIPGAVEAVRSGPDAHAGDAALGIAELRVEGRGLDPELLDHIGLRDVGRDDLVGVGRRGARRAVDQQVAAVAARAIHGVPDDVRRLERPIQPLVTGVRQAGRKPHDLVGIAVDEWERREAHLIHDEPHVPVRRVHRGGPGGDADGLREPADFEDDGQVARLADLDLNVLLDDLPETRELDRDRVDAGEQIVDLKQALFIGRCRGRRAPRGVGDGDRRSGDRPGAGIGDSSAYLPARFLSAEGGRDDQGHQQDERARVRTSVEYVSLSLPSPYEAQKSDRPRPTA